MTLPLRFAHLVAVEQQPRMAEHRAGQRFAERHQDDGPVDGMEAHDVFPDDVEVGRPELL